MEKLHQVDRSNSMGNEYDVQDLPKSGFNLTYNSHVGGLALGRLYPIGYNHIFPKDKFSGRNDYNLIAEPLSTPVISDVNVSLHNYFVTYRSIHKGFEDLLTPTNLNGMSASLSAPSFNLRQIVAHLLGALYPLYPTLGEASTAYYNTYGEQHAPVYDSRYSTVFDPEYFRVFFDDFIDSAATCYNDDAFEDLFKALESPAYAIAHAASSTTDVQFLRLFTNFWSVIFDFFCGEGSLMDYLGYPIMRHEDVKEWLVLSGEALYGQWEGNVPSSYNNLMVQGWRGGLGIYNINVNEYALRAYYAIWFEYYRVNELEPRSSSLWEYHDFGFTSLFASSTIRKAISCILPLRIRPWTKDPFTTAQVDDISRHVYSPIINRTLSSGSVKYDYPSMPAQQTVGSNSLPQSETGNLWSQVNIDYVNPVSGQVTNISCPMPSGLSNMTVGKASTNNSTPYMLDLFTLQKAKMMERYLKRNLAFGDEYRDRMKAHYDVTIEDYRINRPAYLSGSVKLVDIKQEVANTGSVPGDDNDGLVNQGARLAIGTANNNGVSDGYEFFATEFGIVITLMSIVPRAQYDPTCPHNFMLKTMDFPSPEFAMQQEDIMHNSEIMRLGVVTGSQLPFGHVPYAHPYRYRVDEVHGQMLSSKFDYTFARFYQGYTNDGSPKLNYKFIHCRPNIPMFVNQILLDGQFYGTIKHNFLVERLLPQPVETI